MLRMKSLIYGYMNVADGLDDQEIRRAEGGFREFAETKGFCFAATFHEYERGLAAFDELTCELVRAEAHDVVVPSLGHLSAHPLLRIDMLTRLGREANAHVWVAAPLHLPTRG